MRYILVKDMTRLFTKEMLLYSLFDISFKKPIRLVFLVYLILLLLIYSLPLTILLWPFNKYSAMLIIIPPFLLASLMSSLYGEASHFLVGLNVN